MAILLLLAAAAASGAPTNKGARRGVVPPPPSSPFPGWRRYDYRLLPAPAPPGSPSRGGRNSNRHKRAAAADDALPVPSGPAAAPPQTLGSLLEEAARYLSEEEMSGYDLEDEGSLARLREDVAARQAQGASFSFGYSIQVTFYFLKISGFPSSIFFSIRTASMTATSRGLRKGAASTWRESTRTATDSSSIRVSGFAQYKAGENLDNCLYGIAL